MTETEKLSAIKFQQKLEVECQGISESAAGCGSPGGMELGRTQQGWNGNVIWGFLLSALLWERKIAAVETMSSCTLRSTSTVSLLPVNSAFCSSFRRTL